MLQRKVLIIKLLAIDRYASSTIAVQEVAALTHEVRDDSVEG